MLPLTAIMILTALSSAAPAEGPARITCSQKTFPNLPGQNAVTLARQPNGSYTASYESYGPPKTRKGLKCAFDANPLVFHCLTANAGWGIFASKLDERSIDGAGKATDEHVYKVEAVSTPQGEPRPEKELRFPLDSCKAER
jgi:hypothetical protein